MVELVKYFIKEKVSSSEMLQNKPINRIEAEFRDYVFKIYFFSYIKKTIICSSLQLIKKTKSLQEQELLTLNVIDPEYNEERLNIIRDKEVCYMDELCEQEDTKLEHVVIDDDIVKAIYTLTDRQKEIIYKSIVIGRSDPEIAKELGISKQAVGKSKNSAIGKLRDILNIKEPRN